jgi:hypothetical protein
LHRDNQSWFIVGRFALLRGLHAVQAESGNEEFEMTSLLRRFLNDEQGQDLIEYTLCLKPPRAARPSEFVNQNAALEEENKNLKAMTG